MRKLLLVIICPLFFLLLSSSAYAKPPSFITVVNPVRGSDFWDLEEKPLDAVKGQLEILRQSSVSATWLLRYDSLQIGELAGLLKDNQDFEKGLLLEVTPAWTSGCGVIYQQSASWHSAASVFLTGYTQEDRIKLIDCAFSHFKEIYNYYPTSVGAWWIDSFSLDYMQTKYQVAAALIVSDQYTTDNYQIWGQYFDTPYYPSKRHALFPAQSIEDKLPIVMMQWAARDPINGYGERVEDSTYSVQANDYLDYHKLSSAYFGQLLDVLLNQDLNQFNQVVVGLENSYSWSKYQAEYGNQIKILAEMRDKGEADIVSMGDFASWYKERFPEVSPAQVIVASDPLNSGKRSVWFMNPHYRAGWFYTGEGSVFRDVRQYIEGQIEPCYNFPCQSLNFASNATRVLDDVTFHKRLLLDQGKINQFQVESREGKFILSYQNEAGRARVVEFLPRDISVDGKISSIDGFILDANVSAPSSNIDSIKVGGEELSLYSSYRESLPGIFFKAFKYLIFLVLGALIPGYCLVRKIKLKSFLENLVLSLITGFVLLTLAAFIGGYIKAGWLIFIYPLFSLAFLIYSKAYLDIKINLRSNIFSKANLVLAGIIVAGTIFQTVMELRSGWVYSFGVGFWGPLGHDGIWHQALINQLAKGLPPLNPALAGNTLGSYHFFYDLLASATFRLTSIPAGDLLYRFYPVTFSVLLGLGSFLLALNLFKNRVAACLSLYFVYFTGSFGWIVEFLRERHWGGESAFWANQPVSMNHNPPFAISLVILIAVTIIWQVFKTKRTLVTSCLLVLLLGSLIEFKVYAAVISILSLSVLALSGLIKRDFTIFYTALGSVFIAAGLFLPQNTNAQSLLIFAPFWFVHSMVDFPDRVGWLRLSMARSAYQERGELVKYFLTEGLGLFIFITGNLGTRIISLPLIAGIFKKGSGVWGRYEFILLMVFFSFLIPVIFIQKGNPWNTIQFIYYGLYFTALLSGYALYKLFSTVPKLIALPLIFIVIIITPINAVTTFTSAWSKYPPAALSLQELEALNNLKKQPEGVVLTYPFDKSLRGSFKDPYPLAVYESSAYVSAFSGKTTYLEDEMQQEIFQESYLTRRVSVMDFFRSNDNNLTKKFLEDNNIRYIYLPKLYNIKMPETEGVKPFFENQEVTVYKYIKP